MIMILIMMTVMKMIVMIATLSSTLTKAVGIDMGVTRFLLTTLKKAQR